MAKGTLKVKAPALLTKQRMSKRIVVGVIAVVQVVTFFAFLRFGGELLVAEDALDTLDPLEAPDNVVIVLLMGSIPDRALGALDLFHQVEARHIVMVRSNMTGYEAFEADFSAGIV